jgi:N-acetylated-alpha-linked acidic dipeptidase
MTRWMMLLAALLIGSVPPDAKGQGAPVGFNAANGAKQRDAERGVIQTPTPASAAVHSRALSRETHVAGTAAQLRTRDYVITQMKGWGLETEVRTYEVFMPHATGVRVLRVSPQSKELVLSEPAVVGDPTSTTIQYLTVNGYSGAGDVTGDVVYVNYGLIEDYAQLDSMGISVQGRIVVARYGRSFRGIKAREAEKRGARALLIYSDPQDDGFVRGDVYPEGAMRPAFGVQRGSVMNASGDPSTPGYASVAGAARLSMESFAIPRIPVVPVSFGNAAELLRDLRGAAVPQTWQGGLAFRYHAGPGPVQARVIVTDDRATKPYKPIYNTFATIRGSEFPDELVMVGAHRDAWGPGAADNVSGIVSTLEAARAIAALVQNGQRPKRTIVFATWDAEEWGLIGSTEYVEDDSLRLLRSAVAYLNQDVAAQGSRFSGGGSPSLRATLRDVAATIPDPNGRGTIYDEWRKAAGATDTVTPAMGDPGGGSDFAGFYNHLGIPIADWGFGGAGGVYHSQYDGTKWMETFGDPGYRYHAAAGRIAAAFALRLANAEILPFDYVEYARTLRRYLPEIDRGISARRWSESSAPIVAALTRMEQAATDFATQRDDALRAGLPAANAQRANAALMSVERALTRAEGLTSRPWFRNLVYASDENNGYATMPLPSINEAIRRGDAALTRREISDLARRLDAATTALRDARQALGR